MVRWHEVVNHLEETTPTPNGLLLSNCRPRGDAENMLQRGIEALSRWGDMTSPPLLTREHVASAMNVDPAQVNQLAARQHFEMLAPIIAMNAPAGEAVLTTARFW